jgi:hypothetical protein
MGGTVLSSTVVRLPLGDWVRHHSAEFRAVLTGVRFSTSDIRMDS